MTTSKTSTFDGIKLYYQRATCLRKWSWKDETSQNLHDSVQLQTVLALYDLVTVRNSGQPSNSRLKTTVKLHIDQMMRTRNFRARNEVAERGAVTKSQKGNKAQVERKVGECFQGTAHGQYSKGASCSLSHDTLTLETVALVRDEKGRSSSPASNSKAKTDGEGQKPSKESGNEEESSSDTRNEIPCRFRICKNTSCKIWHPPVCQKLQV